MQYSYGFLLKMVLEVEWSGGMDLSRVYDRLVPADHTIDMKATIKFLRLNLTTLTCMDEVKHILQEWGLNRKNDGCLRFHDFAYVITCALLSCTTFNNDIQIGTNRKFRRRRSLRFVTHFVVYATQTAQNERQSLHTR